MPTENTTLKNVSPAVESNTTDDVVIGKSNIYQRSFLIVAGSLLALLVRVAVAGKSGGQHLQTSTYEIVEGAVALVDYQVDSANSALTKDIFDLGVVSENDEAGNCYDICCFDGCYPICCDKSKPFCSSEDDCDCYDNCCDNCYHDCYDIPGSF